MNMIDLHMHSTFSDDGQYEPSQLIKMCQEKHIEMLSITDHNCAKANDIARKEAANAGIKYIEGIEIDCIFQGLGFHVLGYGIDDKHHIFEEIEENVRVQNLEASRQRLKLTQELGFPITEEELWEATKDNYWQGMWFGEVFAEILLKKPELKNNLLLAPYREGGARSVNPLVNFQWDFYAQGKPCYVELKFPEMEKVIRLIHESGGIAVLAHPGANLSGHEDKLESILNLGIDGIEAFSSYHTPEIASQYYREAVRHRLLYTCGSDFHGKTKPAIPLGGAVFGQNMDAKEQMNIISAMLLQILQK